MQGAKRGRDISLEAIAAIIIASRRNSLSVAGINSATGSSSLLQKLRLPTAAQLNHRLLTLQRRQRHRRFEAGMWFLRVLS